MKHQALQGHVGKLVVCRCGHFLHWRGEGQCLDCLCDSYRPDLDQYPMGQMWVSS